MNPHVHRIFEELRKSENNTIEGDTFQPNERRPSVPVYYGDRSTNSQKKLSKDDITLLPTKKKPLLPAYRENRTRSSQKKRITNNDDNIQKKKRRSSLPAVDYYNNLNRSQENNESHEHENDFDSDDSQADKDYVPIENSSDSSDTNTIEPYDEQLKKIEKVKKKLFTHDSKQKTQLQKYNNIRTEQNVNIYETDNSRNEHSVSKETNKLNNKNLLTPKKKEENKDDLITIEDLVGNTNNNVQNSNNQKTPAKTIPHSLENINVLIVEGSMLCDEDSPKRDISDENNISEAEKQAHEALQDSQDSPKRDISDENNRSEAENQAHEALQDSQTKTRPLTESSTKKKPKKRIRNEADWKKNKAKKAKLAGSPYISLAKTQKPMEAKKIKEPCSCRAKCYEKIEFDQRKVMFEQYWKICNKWEQRRQFIASNVTRKDKERTKVSSIGRSRRKYTYEYSFPCETGNIPVCKTMFLNTLNVGEKFVKLCIEKKMDSGLIRPDQRGKHRPPNKTDEKIVQSVIDHISSYPSYESHYTRNKSSKRYLGPELNLTLMYKHYRESMTEKNIPTDKIAKEWLYRDIFNTKFNLAFKLPGVDTCDDCDRLNRQLKDPDLNATEKENYAKQRDDHLKAADQRYDLKRIEKEESIKSKNKRVLMLDLQKCFPTPCLTNTQSFYLRKLWTLNLTIHDATTKTSYNLMWPENIAGRGGNEIASCLLYWASKNLDSSAIEEVTVWTDNCTGQNRNMIVVFAYIWIMHKYPNIKCINHKFLLKGHTHMECDHIHALIERKKKKLTTMEIASPRDWVQFVKTCSGRNPFHVQEMTLNDMKDLSSLSDKTGPLVQRKKSTSGEDFKISDTVWWQIRRETPGSLFYKTSFNEDTFKQVNLNRNIKNPKKLPEQLPNIRHTQKPISSSKYKDLITLLQWIPVEFHELYKKLPHDDTASEVPETDLIFD